MGNYESKKYGKRAVMNAYLPGELYSNLRIISFEKGASLSWCLSTEINKFVDWYESGNVYNEYLSNVISGLKSKAQCMVYRIEQRKKIGVVLGEEIREKVNKIAKELDTTISELFRAIALNYVNKRGESQAGCDVSKSSALVTNNENKFEMYIDLA